MVRLSSSVSGCFTISRVISTGSEERKYKITHSRVDYKGNDSYSFKQDDKRIKSKGVTLRKFLHVLKGELNLQSSCGGSKFRVLFKEKTVAPNDEEDDGYDHTIKTCDSNK